MYFLCKLMTWNYENVRLPTRGLSGRIVDKDERSRMDWDRKRALIVRINAIPLMLVIISKSSLVLNKY
eukprot:snap_masked-scaffold_16-processed-gene-5.31-mRNA-1 protein AED:1.00 eAED:1.00 QI:0/-1/0/0/-1/1/1/0/67